MTVKTNYRKSGAGALVRYIASKGQLYDRSGLEIDRAEDFVERSNELNFERVIILSPPNGKEMSDRDLSLYARRQIKSQFHDAPSVDYVYGVHRDTRHHHVIVAAIGERRDLYLDRDDLERMRSREHEVLRELGYGHQLEQFRNRQEEYEYDLV